MPLALVDFHETPFKKTFQIEYRIFTPDEEKQLEPVTYRIN
jgi:hypothetical protein